MSSKPSPAEWVWRALYWPHPLAPEQALGLMRQWAADQRSPQLVLEARASKSGVRYLLGARPRWLPGASRIVAQLVAGARVSQVDVLRHQVLAAGRLRLNTRHRALNTTTMEAAARAVLSGLTTVRSDEELVLQLVLGPRRVPLAIPTNSPAASVQPWWQIAWYGTNARLDGEKRTALRSKVAEHGYACTLRLGAMAETPERRRQLLLGLLAGLRTAETAGLALRLVPERASRLNRGTTPWRWPLRLNVSEVLALSGWPLGDEVLPGQPPAHPRQLGAADAVRGHGRVLALSTLAGDPRPLGLSVADARHHTHLLGPTGTGKSTLLMNLILADITAGRGLVLLDPKGDLVNDVLARVPAERANDIVILDPSDRELPVGLNPLAGAGQVELAVDGVLAVFRGLYADSWGPRTGDILHAALLTLARRRDASLVMVPLLLTNPGFRRSLTAQLDDPIALGPFWAWYEAMSEGERGAAIAPVMNKLRAFLLRPSMRAVLGQVRPRFQLRQVFTERKVLLVSLAKGLLGPEAARLLGSLVVAQLWQTILARAVVPPAQRHTVMIYIDEVQDYLHLPTDIADALAQSRSLGAAFSLAHQSLAQLPIGMRESILANTRSRVCFQLGASDAAVMAKASAGLLMAEDFQSLGRYELYASLMADGAVTPFASGRSLPPPSIIREVGVLREQSRQRYGQPPDAVERGIAELARGGNRDDEPAGRRPRRPV
ncbi:MAG: type IV secretory system conjugative DNA transfer family protein [Mycobacteriales bacterium]